ncbi:MAG: ABC transporter ATP-binding protein [Candidatus Dormibacteraeota bacterium]|nr:ABC transporter ATP-binding protein [Candidatus Dormibacteraeota bacterium]
MAEICIERVTKTFAGATAVNDVSLTIEDGEFMVLLGPSGCGKTTLLRLIAGFELADSGAVSIGGRDVSTLSPGRRDIAMVFQSYALFPHLRVYDNVAFGLRMHHVAKADIGPRVREAAELMGIEPFLQRYPTQLSGGQRQRVAVARALVMRPSVILMDEPLSNLDALLRLQMRAELKRLLHEIKTTTVYVTHDQVEALSMGDRTAVMRDGGVLQCASPMEVYDRPADVFVAQFIGNPPMNVLHAMVVDGGVELEGNRLPVGTLDGARPGQEAEVGIRAENIEVSSSQADGDVEATVRVIEPLGSHLLMTLSLGSQTLKANTRTDFQAHPGSTVWLRLEPGSLRLLGSTQAAEAASIPA